MYHGILKSLPPAQDPNGDESRRPWWRRGSGEGSPLLAGE